MLKPKQLRRALTDSVPLLQRNPDGQYLQTANALAEIKDAGLVTELLKNIGLADNNWFFIDSCVSKGKKLGISKSGEPVLEDEAESGETD